jgi:hypothetical protein
MSREDSSPVGVGFALEGDSESRPLEAEVEPSDPGEEAADIHRTSPE